MSNSRIYYFVGDLNAQTSSLLAVLRDLFLQLVPENILEPMFATGEDGKPLHQAIDERLTSAAVPIELLQAICAATQRTWPYEQSVRAYMSARTDTRVEADGTIAPVRRLAELILAGPAGVDLSVLPPLIETVLQMYGDAATVIATRGEVQAWDLGSGWRFITDVRTPRHCYGVALNG